MMAGNGFSPQLHPRIPPWMPIDAPPMNHAGMSQGKHQHQQGGHGPGDFDEAAGERHGPGGAEMRNWLQASSPFTLLNSVEPARSMCARTWD